MVRPGNMFKDRCCSAVSGSLNTWRVNSEASVPSKKSRGNNGLRPDCRYAAYSLTGPVRTARDVMRPFVVRIWDMATCL